MLMLPAKMLYAVEAVLYIAYNATVKPTSSREIAAYQDLPPRYLEQIMQRLVRAGILRSLRGPRGGYVLAREKRRITIGEICEIIAIEEEGESPTPKTALGKQVLLPIWLRIQETLLKDLRTVSMAELCDKAFAGQIRRLPDTHADFTI